MARCSAAPDIDGAGNWAKFRYVTIPMLSPALFYNLVTSTIAALQLFEVGAFIQTPESVGTFVNCLIYQEAFTLRNMGMASAMAWILLLIILALTALIFRSSSVGCSIRAHVRKEHDCGYSDA